MTQIYPNSSVNVTALPFVNRSTGEVSVEASVLNLHGGAAYYSARLGFIFKFKEGTGAVRTLSAGWSLSWLAHVSRTRSCSGHGCVTSGALTFVRSILLVEDISTLQRIGQDSRPLMHLTAIMAPAGTTNASGNATSTLSVTANLTGGHEYAVRTMLLVVVTASSGAPTLASSAGLDLAPPYGGWLNWVNLR
jgi:hypothetical protein